MNKEERIERRKQKPLILRIFRVVWIVLLSFFALILGLGLITVITADPRQFEGSSSFWVYDKKPFLGERADYRIPEDDTEIDGILYRGGEVIYLYADYSKEGFKNSVISVRSGILAEDTVIDGESYSAGTRIEFDEEGRL